ncbi:GumC family protein [Parafilimonas sp.]|uniref:GumC family protein n=1 Tax=Parafilimonas sp. TaxID=1969739 RepID=UPI003F7F67C7
MAAASIKKTVIKEEENEFSFRELLMKSLNYLPMFTLFLAVALIIAYIYIHFQTPVYSTSIKVLIKNAGKESNEDQVLSELLNTSKPNIYNEMEVLQSHQLMARVVKAQQLNTAYYSIGKVNTIEVYEPDPAKRFLVFSNIKDSGRSYNINLQVKKDGIYILHGENAVKATNQTIIHTPDFDYLLNIINPEDYKPDYQYQAVWRPTDAVAGGLAGSVSVSPLSKYSSVLVVSTSSQVPRKAEVILNTLAAEYNSYNIEQSNKIAENTIRFIDDRLIFISGELNEVENNLKNFRVNNSLNISTEGSVETGIAKDLETKLNEQELQMNIADMVSGYINNPKRRYELVPSNLGIGDVTLGALVSNYNADVIKREELLKTMGEKNLQVKALETALDDLRSRIMESVTNVKKVYTDAYNAAHRQYETSLNKIRSIPAKEKQLLEIERQQGIKEKLYLYLLEKREESAVSRAAAVGNSEAVDRASSGGPINLKNSNIYLMALFAGLGLPLLIVYLMDLLNDRVTTRDEILKFTETPIIGEISHFADKERAIIAGRTRGILPEQFRIVRTNLRYFLPKDKKDSTILVTSTMPGEGKTFVSLNLAAVLSVSGRKTILLGFDMRRPKIGVSLEASEAAGDLPGFLAGNIPPEKIIRQVNGYESLYAITTSFVPPNPAELLLSDRLKILFDYLKTNFDYIVIDSPPLGIVSDAKVLSEYADLSLYIVRQRFTQRKQLKMLETMYKEKKLPNLAMVVNDVKVKGIRSYYGYGYTYGGSYGYDYSMGYGYDEGAKKAWWRKLFKKGVRWKV